MKSSSLIKLATGAALLSASLAFAGSTPATQGGSSSFVTYTPQTFSQSVAGAGAPSVIAANATPVIVSSSFTSTFSAPATMSQLTGISTSTALPLPGVTVVNTTSVGAALQTAQSSPTPQNVFSLYVAVANALSNPAASNNVALQQLASALVKAANPL